MFSIVVGNHSVNKSDISPIDDMVGRSFRLMDGYSPCFSTVDALVDWFNQQPSIIKQKHVSIVEGRRCIVVYELIVALKDQLLDFGYQVVEGEVLSIDEYGFLYFK